MMHRCWKHSFLKTLRGVLFVCACVAISGVMGDVAAQDGAGQIVTKDVSPPASTDYGVTETKIVEKPDFTTLSPEQFATLVASFPKHFETIFIKDIWAMVLLAPISQEEAKILPTDWSAARFALLRKLGDIQRLDALLASVPELLANEWTQKERVRRLVASSKVSEACTAVHHHVEALRVDEVLDGFWALMQAACLRSEGKLDQADLALSVINELDAKQVTPLALALVSDGVSVKKPLPPISEADGRAGETLLLAGLLDETRRDGLLARIGADFVDGVDLAGMPAELARELANAGKLSPEKRVLLAEHALVQGVSPAQVLRSLYQSFAIKADGGTIKDSNALRRARIYARITALPDMASKARAIEAAFPDFRAVLGLSHVGELFADEFNQMAASLDAPKLLPSHLALQIAFYHLSHSQRPNVASMVNIYKNAAENSKDDTIKATSAILSQALSLHDAATEGGSPDKISLPVPALANTYLQRTAIIMTSLGFSEPKALLVDSAVGVHAELLSQLHKAAEDDNSALVLISAMKLLGSGAVDVLTNNELAQTIADLKAADFDKAAYALARDGVLVSKL